jgi:hypothetical protein
VVVVEAEGMGRNNETNQERKDLNNFLPMGAVVMLGSIY